MPTRNRTRTWNFLPMNNMSCLSRKLKDAARGRHIGKGYVSEPIITQEMIAQMLRAKDSDVLKHYVGLRRLWMDNYKFVIPLDFSKLLLEKRNNDHE